MASTPIASDAVPSGFLFSISMVRREPNSRARRNAHTAVTAESREDGDSLTETAFDARGAPAAKPMDQGFVYACSFQDSRGHHSEVFRMD